MLDFQIERQIESDDHSQENSVFPPESKINIIEKQDLKMFNSTQIVLFFSPKCSHCLKFKPKFSSLSIKYSSKDLMFSAVNCISNRFLCKIFQTKGYPTIKLLDFNYEKATSYEYTGELEYEELEKFILGDYKKIDIYDKEEEQFLIQTIEKYYEEYLQNQEHLQQQIIDQNKNDKQISENEIFGYYLDGENNNITQQYEEEEIQISLLSYILISIFFIIIIITPQICTVYQTNIEISNKKIK